MLHNHLRNDVTYVNLLHLNKFFVVTSIVYFFLQSINFFGCRWRINEVVVRNFSQHVKISKRGIQNLYLHK